MNQYQEFILPMIKYELFIDKDCREKANNDIGNLSSKKIIIKQAEDYHITE